MSSFLPGAEMTTFLAPASICLAAFSRSVNRPVDSSTISTPRSLQGSCPGSFWASTLMLSPSTISASPFDLDRARVAPVYRVVLEQMGQRRWCR